METDITNTANLNAQVGQLQGITGGMATQLQTMNDEMIRLWTEQSATNEAVVRIEEHTKCIPDLAARVKEMELRCTRQHPGSDSDVQPVNHPTTPTPPKSSSPLDKPIGRTLGEWSLEAAKQVFIKAVTIAIAVVMILVAAKMAPGLLGG